MSANVTAHGNRALGKKGKIFLTDIEILKKNEIQRRRALRLLQVRQQCKDIASQIRERCKDEKSKQLRFYELDLQEELRENEIMRQAILRHQYHQCLNSIGQSHRDAAAQPDPGTVLMIDRKQWKKESDRRGEAALKLHKAQIAAAAQKQEDAEKQRNFVRTVENIRSTVVASLPKKLSCPSGGSKGRETKSKLGKKAPLRDVNKIPVPVPPSSDVFMLVPTHPDEPLMQQGPTSQGSSFMSLSSVSQRPPCIDKFVNKLASRLGTRGSTVDSLSSIGSQTSENRGLSVPSSDALPLQLANSSHLTEFEQKKILEPDKKQTDRSVTFSSSSDERFVENLVETDIQTGTSKPCGSKSATREEKFTSYKSVYAGETLLTESLKQVDEALKKSSEQRSFRKIGSVRGVSESDAVESISKSSSHSVSRNIENVDEAVVSAGSMKGRPTQEASQFISHLPTVWNDSVSNRFSRPHGLDVIEEEEGVDGEAQSGAPVIADAKKQKQMRGNETEGFPSLEQAVNVVVDYNSNETQAELGSSETSSHRVQLYDHTHRFKHDYDASTSISVTRLIRDGENDARTEAAAVESASAAATDAASSAVAGRAAETSAILSAPYPTAVPMGYRGREALRRQRLEREYQNLLSALGVLSREERISRTVAGFGNPVEAHISDARLKERHAERQHIISSAFQNVVGDVEALASYKSPMSPPVKLPASNVNVAEPEPVMGQGDGAQLTAKQIKTDSPAAALNVGMWTTLPVSSHESVGTVTHSPKPPSTPSSSENSIILVPPHPSVPSTPLSPVQESQSMDSREEMRHFAGAMPSEDIVAKVKPIAEHVEESPGPSIRDLQALEGLLERVRQQRDRLLAGKVEPSQLPPLPPSPPPPPVASAGPGDSASADVSASSVDAQSPPLPPPPPLPPHAARPRPPRPAHRPRHSRHSHQRPRQVDERPGKDEGAAVDEGRTSQTEASASSPEEQQQQQQPASQPPPRSEGGHKGGRGTEHRRRRAGGRGVGRSRSAAASLSPSQRARELSVDVAVKSEGAICGCYRPRDVDAMRLRVSVTGDGDTGDGRRHHHHRHARRADSHAHHTHPEECDSCGRGTCLHRKPPPPPPSKSSGDSQPAGPSPRQSPAASPAPASRSRTPQPRSPSASGRGPARPPPPPSPPPPPTPGLAPQSPRASPQRSPSRPPCSAPHAPCQKRRKSPKRARSAQKSSPSPGRARATARSPAKKGPAASGTAPCWSERLGRTPPWRTAEDSASTLYFSPPDQLHAPHLDSLVGLLRCRAVPVVVCTEGECQRGGGGGGVPAGPVPLDPLLERYVTRLLAMSQANLEALNVSSSDVSLTSEVLGHPHNTACRAGEESTERSPGTPAPAPTPVSSPEGSPGRRSVGVEVTPEDLHQPCAACAPCARHPPEPCVVPRPRSPLPPKHTTERSRSPVGSLACPVHPEKPRNQAHLPSCTVAASKPGGFTTKGRSAQSRAAHPTRPPQRRSCSPTCPPSCAASASAPSPAPLPRSPAAANSPSTPLDTTEYLQHELFTRGAFRRVPASAPPADPALPHDSPDYRPLAAPPLRVGGGDRGADSSHSAHSDASPPSWCACAAAKTPAPPSQQPTQAKDDAWQSAAADVAEMSQRCARRIESLARLIEHVRSEKNHLAELQVTPTDASSPEDGRSPLLQETPRLNRLAPTHAPVRSRTPPRTRPPARSPTPPRSPGRAQRVEWSPETPAPRMETADGVDRNETWFQRLQRQSPPSAGQQPSLIQRSPPPQGATRSPASPTRRPASSPHRAPVRSTASPPRARTQLASPSKRTPEQPSSPLRRSPEQPTSPLRRSPEQPATSPQLSPGQSTSPRQPASSPPPTSPPSGGCGHACPGHVVSPPASPARSRPFVCAPADEGAPEGLVGGDEETLWVFAPGSWPPCPGSWGRVQRPKPPPAMWRPGVPYVQQHELSAIPEADVSQSMLEAGASDRRSPASPPHSPLVFGTVTGEAAEFRTGPRENLHGLLIATHLAAQQVDPWLPPEESSPPRITSPVSHAVPHAPHSPSPFPPYSHDSPPAQTEFLPCSYPFPPPCAMSPRISTSPPRSHSPGPSSPRAPSPHTCSPPCSRPCSPQGTAAEQQEDENDPDIVAELIRRGVLRSPFSWMKSAESGPQIDVDVDVSVISGASSDFVSDLLISGSSSTPRKAQRSSPDSPEQQHRRQRGGADPFDPSPEASPKQPLTDDLLRLPVEDSGTLETLPEDLEGMFERLGLGWAASMLRKTQEAMAISSSSSEASRGASRPSGGGGSGGDINSSNVPGGGNGTNVCVEAGTHSKPRRGHSTPADASAASDGSGSVSWARRQVVFTGDSDMSSVIGVSSRDLSTPSVSLVVKSKSKSDQVT